MISEALTWKDWPISRLGVTQSLMDACDEDGVFTIGQLMESDDYKDDEEVVKAMGIFYETHPEIALDEENAADAVAQDEMLAASDIRLRHLQQILKANQKWQECEDRAKQALEQARDLKKEADAHGKALRRLIARGPNPQRELPFASEEDEGDDDTFAELAVPKDWRKAEVGEALGLTAKQQEKLAEAGITNMGQFEDLRGSDDGLMSIKGIGRALADQLEDRAMEWLDQNRDLFGEAIDPAKPSDA